MPGSRAPAIAVFLALMSATGCSDGDGNGQAADADGGGNDGSADGGDSNTGDEESSGADDGGADDSGASSCRTAGAASMRVSEVGIQPAGAEFIEVWNAGDTAVDLTDFYLSDNAAYHSLPAGTDWIPLESVPGTDFLARFPPGTVLDPGATLVVQAAAGDFHDQFAVCPDLALGNDPATCQGVMVPKMIAPTDGDLGSAEGTLLSNDNEMLILFCWDGRSASVTDADYVSWGADYDDTTRVDKTGLPGYLPDSPRASQAAAPTAGTIAGGMSIARCDATEAGERATGGNGCTGHDETSEQLATSFQAQASATPGAAGVCE